MKKTKNIEKSKIYNKLYLVMRVNSDIKIFVDSCQYVLKGKHSYSYFLTLGEVFDEIFDSKKKFYLAKEKIKTLADMQKVLNDCNRWFKTNVFNKYKKLYSEDFKRK